MFDAAEGDSSVDSVTRSRGQQSSGMYGVGAPSELVSELVSVRPGFQPSIDIDFDMGKLLDHVPHRNSRR
eukprot:2576823-Pyramimonas_sp.AAC.1